MAVHPAIDPETGALPTVVIIGAMKCGTTALHRCLDDHPSVSMAVQKELNFFFGPADPADRPDRPLASNWHRGLEWYTAQFQPDAPVRGESSPGYTSPEHPEVAGRMAAVVPEVGLIYLVRDPVARAVSQYRHHVADGDERRPIDEALLDPASQYLSRGRYYERLTLFLDHFPADRMTVVAQEQLLTDPQRTLAGLFRFLGVDDAYWSAALQGRWNTSRTTSDLPSDRVVDRMRDSLRDDADRLRELTGQEFPYWSV